MAYCNILLCTERKMNKSQENETKILQLKSPAGVEPAIYQWPLPRYVS